MNAIASSSKSPVPFPSNTFLGASLPVDQSQLRYDHRGRLLPFVETGAQKRERLAFIKTQEQSRRVSEWVITSSTSRSKVSSHSLPSKNMTLITRNEQRAVFDSSSLEPTELPGRPDLTAEEDESTSRWSASPVSPPAANNLSPTELPWPGVMAESRSHRRSSSACSSRSSRSSLGSILEEEGKQLY